MDSINTHRANLLQRVLHLGLLNVAVNDEAVDRHRVALAQAIGAPNHLYYTQGDKHTAAWLSN